jgi:hypothetical protein
VEWLRLVVGVAGSEGEGVNGWSLRSRDAVRGLKFEGR